MASFFQAMYSSPKERENKKRKKIDDTTFRTADKIKAHTKISKNFHAILARNF